MASETPETVSQTAVEFDFKTFFRTLREKELSRNDIKSFVESIASGVINDLQLCAFLCAINEKPLKLSKLISHNCSDHCQYKIACIEYTF